MRSMVAVRGRHRLRKQMREQVVYAWWGAHLRTRERLYSKDGRCLSVLSFLVKLCCFAMSIFARQGRDCLDAARQGNLRERHRYVWQCRCTSCLVSHSVVTGSSEGPKWKVER